MLIEYVKYHFPEELAEIENMHNDEYLKKRQIIQEEIDRLQPQNVELKEVA